MWRHNSSASLNTAPASATAAAAAAAPDSSSASTDAAPASATTATAPASSSSSVSSSSTTQSAMTGDDIFDNLPPGWTRKESKTQKGRYYYISPAGKTQWTPPLLRVRAASRVPLEIPTFNWVNEVEIEFGEGRLGVSLREVRQYESTPYPLFQAEVDDLPKINGKAGPAELYNWSVKPHKRLMIGMRVSGIEDLCLAGLTYKEVVDRLKKAPRPLRIRFADVEKGTVEDHPELALRLTELEEGDSGAQSSAYLQQKQEYTRVLVTSELHTELWTIETKKLLRSMAVMKKKWDAVSSEFDVLNERRLDLRKENERLVSEKQKYETMIKHLKLQEIHAMENPELVKANALAKRNASLTEDIAKMSAGNKRLRKERVALQSALDEVEGVLAKLDASAAADGEPDKASGDDEFFGIDLTAPSSELLAAFKKKMRFMEEELSKEQRKATKVQREMDQLNRHLNNLSAPSSTSLSASSSKSRSDDKSSSASASGTASSVSSSSGKSSLSSSSSSAASAVSPEIARLEAKILELRKQQRSVVETMSKAAQVGDQDLAKECQRRRHAIKEELKHAQDELHRVKTEGTTPSLSSSSSSGREGSSGSKPALTTSASTVGTSSSRARKHSVNPALKSSSSSVSSSSLPHEPQQSSEQPQRAKKAEKMPTLFGFLDKGPTEWSERGLIRNMKTMRGARERWCEITPDGFLKYYKRRGDPVVRGEIDLSDKSLEIVCEDTKRGREFVISTSEQQSHFFTKSTPELDKWVKTLRAAQKYLVTNNQLDALMKKAEAADKRNNDLSSSGMGHGAQQAIESFPEEDEQFYGRATLGF